MTVLYLFIYFYYFAVQAFNLLFHIVFFFIIYYLSVIIIFIKSSILWYIPCFFFLFCFVVTGWYLYFNLFILCGKLLLATRPATGEVHYMLGLLIKCCILECFGSAGVPRPLHIWYNYWFVIAVNLWRSFTVSAGPDCKLYLLLHI
jgi:hypothetical protein